jgi:hypothetical protein
MLPFDNKSEFQVIVDMPEGTTLEQTARVLGELGRYLGTVEEVTDYQVYAGTAAPINFNGLVRQYYLRTGANVGDIQVNLVDKKHRHRKSHDIALACVGRCRKSARYNANVKVVEVPPGPPVMSPLVAEVYGLNYPGQIQAAQQVRRGVQRHAGHHRCGRYGRGAVRAADRPCGPGQGGVARAYRSRRSPSISTPRCAARMSATCIPETAKYPIPLRLELPVADKAGMAPKCWI